LKKLIKQIDSEILTQIVGIDRVKKIKAILNDTSFKVDLPEIVLALYGQNVLENLSLRKEVIKLLPNDTIDALAKKYCGKVYSSKESNAIQLASKNWTATSKFSYDLIISLGIGIEYIPKRAQRLNTVEFIEPVDTYYPLFKYQNDTKHQIVNNINQNNKRFIVQMPTGSGKTKTCMESLVEFNSLKRVLDNEKSFIWIAHTEELCEQAISSLKTIWNHSQDSVLRIIRYWGGYEPSEEELYGSFIFSTYQKLSSRKSDYYVNILSNTCSIVVVDEAHKATATTYSKMLDTLCTNGAILIGLTATPGRSTTDKMENAEFVQYFNKQIIVPTLVGNPIVALKEMDILSTISHSTIESHINLQLPEEKIGNNKVEFSSKQLQLLSINAERNRLIVRIVKEEIASNNPCLVFTCSVEHSVILTGVLKFLGIKAAYVDSRLKKTLRRKIISDFKDGKYDVLLNFGVLTTGFDAPRIQSIIITRPTTSIVLYSQMIGRGLRGKKVGGNRNCKIIDIKDNHKDFGHIEEIYDFFAGYWA